MTTQTPDSDFDLLELVVVILENIRLLLVGPLLAALLALGVAIVNPQKYESVSVLSVAQYVEPEVLSGLAASANMQESVSRQLALPMPATREEALREWRELVRLTVDKKNKLVTLSTRADSAEQARRVNQTVLAELFRLTRPRGEAAAVLQAQLESEKTTLSSALALEAELARQIAKGGAIGDEKGRVYADVLQTKSRLMSSIGALQLKLAGLGTDDVVQSPTLPDRPISQKKSLTALLAALVTGFVLLLFVALRHSWTRVGARPDAAEKIRRMRRALGLRVPV